MFDHFHDLRLGVLAYALAAWLVALVLARLTNMPKIALRRYIGIVGTCAVLWALAHTLPIETIYAERLSLVTACIFLFTSARTILLAAVSIAGSVFAIHGQRIYADLASFILGLVIVVVALSRIGIDSTSLFTGSAIITALLALAMKETLGNMFAGVSIRVQQPFDIGDWIQYDDKREHIGKVMEINWRATTIRTLDAVSITIPNSKIVENPICNYSAPATESRRSVFLTCPYHVSPERVQAAVYGCLHGIEGVCVSPAPSIVTFGFTDRGVEYWLRFFIRDLDRRDGIDGSVRDRVWFALAAAGIPLSLSTTEILVSRNRPETFDKSTARIAKELSNSILFKDIPADAVQLLAEQGSLRTAVPGEIVVAEKEEGTELFVVASGSLEVSKLVEGKQLAVGTLNIGDCFGERSLLLGERRSSTVKAVKNCELIVLDKATIKQLLTAHPSVVELISDLLAKRESATIDRIADAKRAPDRSQPTMLARIRRFLSVG